MRFGSSLVLLSVVSLIVAPSPAGAAGAYVVESQYRFESPMGVTIVNPFVDGSGQVWVLGNQSDPVECTLIGPVDRDEPPIQGWTLPDEGEGTPPTQCVSVTPGPEGGFLIRGFRAPELGSADPPVGFIVALDDAFEILWGPTFDDEYVEVGIYGEPLPEVSWSERRGRVMAFFTGLIQIGPDSATQLHGLSIADGTGLVRRVVSDWGGVSNGELQGLQVIPEDGKFLVVAHANGTEFLIYDGLDSIDRLLPGEVEWDDESVDYVQYGDDEALYIVHHPRLDLNTLSTTLTRASADGATQYYSRDMARQVEVPAPDVAAGVDVDILVDLERPVLSYVTSSTVTLVRSAGVEFALHVLDNANGQDLVVQPLSSIDENIPTHMANAGQPDRLILMTGAQQGSVVNRYVNTIAWDPDAESSVVFGGPDTDAGGDLGGLGDAGTGANPNVEVGCCRTAATGRAQGVSVFVLGLLALGLASRRRKS